MSQASLSSPLGKHSGTHSDAKVIALVGLVHSSSHFTQLVLPPLFPWLSEAFGVSNAALGAVLTVFFVVSCVVQALSGFAVDRWGARPVLYMGLACMVVGIAGYALAPSYSALMLAAVVAGIGNGVFHPVDFTILNRKVSSARLGHAYSVHGLSGSLGWAFAPALVVTVASMTSWRMALWAAAAVVAVIMVVGVLGARILDYSQDTGADTPSKKTDGASAQADESPFGFLALPAVWVCLGFFFLFAVVLSVVQTFAAPAAAELHNMPLTWVGLCVTLYMVANAAGMIAGGFLVQRSTHAERIVAFGFGIAAVCALFVALGDWPAVLIPAVFTLMGFVSGLAGPSRDMLVKRSTPLQSSGRVYGVVYSGLDIGQASAPLLFGWLMDHHHLQSIWIGLAAVQLLLIGSAVAVSKLQRRESV